MTAGTALAAKQGGKQVNSLQGSSKGMYESMNKKELEDLALTSSKNLSQKL